MRVVPVGPNLVGRRLAKSVVLKDGRVLLKAGTVLTPAYVESLARRGFQWVHIHHELLPDLVLDADISEQLRIRATEQVYRAAESVSKRRPLDHVGIERTAEMLLEEVRSNGDVIYGLAVVRAADDDTFTHSVNVAILSLAIGLRSGLTDRLLRRLGVGALLHDIGKALLPKELLKKREPLTPEEREIMKTHTTLGFQALREEAPSMSPLSTNVALSHHERLDGSGYPRGIRDPEIHLFSKIVAVADVWDAMVSNRPYRPGVSEVEAARTLAAGAGRLFRPELVQRLLVRVAVFPTGTYVRLSDGRAGVVTRQTPNTPTQPEVTVLWDRRNRPVKPTTVRIGEDGLFIDAVMDHLPSALDGRAGS